jgi:hypothetical protein
MTDFRCYISQTGQNEVRQWYAAQSPNVQGAIFAVIEALRHRPRHLWRRKPFGQLRGPLCLGLGEIRIEEPKRSHYRILGFFPGPSSDFILLYGFAKSSDPAYEIACPEAQRRRAEIEQDQSQAQDRGYAAIRRAREWNF